MKASQSIRKNLSSVSKAAAVAAISLAMLSSCTKKETSAEQPQATQSAAAPAAAPSAAAGAPSAATAAVNISLASDGDNLYFNKKEFDVKAGQTVKVSFKNASSAAANMSHNWVLTKPGTEQAVANDSMAVGEAKDWVAEGPNVVAHTKLAKSGETVSVTFSAPAAGDYTYICTFPGHSMTMKGVMHVK